MCLTQIADNECSFDIKYNTPVKLKQGTISIILSNFEPSEIFTNQDWIAFSSRYSIINLDFPG